MAWWARVLLVLGLLALLLVGLEITFDHYQPANNDPVSVDYITS